MEPKDLNAAADMFAEEDGPGEAEADFTDAERPSGVYKTRGRPRKRGQAPAFGPSKGARANGGGHRDDPTRRDGDPPEWLERAWRGDKSLLPMKPPGRS